MRKVISALNILYQLVFNAAMMIAIFLVVFIVFLISASVVLRKTPYPIGWALEVSEYIIIIVTFFGAGWVLKSGKHARVDVIQNALKRKEVSNIYNGAIFTAVAIICLILTVFGILTAVDAFFLGTLQTQIFTFPKWILISVIPFGSFFLFIEALKTGWRYFKGTRDRSGDQEKSDFQM